MVSSEITNGEPLTNCERVNELRRQLHETLGYAHGLAVESACRAYRERQAGVPMVLTVVEELDEVGLDFVRDFSKTVASIEGEPLPIWRSGESGSHWQFVEKHRRAVIVFSELEELLPDANYKGIPRGAREDENWQAHTHSVLSQLRKGRFKNPVNGSLVDYSRAWLVWIPKRGLRAQRKFLFRANEEVQDNRDAILQALVEERDFFGYSHPRESRPVKHAFFSHQNKGPVIWMDCFPAALRIRQVKQLEKHSQRTHMPVQYKDEASRFLLTLTLTNQQGFSPRRLEQHFAGWQSMVLDRMGLEPDLGSPSFIEIQAGRGKGTAGEWLRKQLHERPVKILIQDSGRRIERELTKVFPNENIQFIPWCEFNEAINLAPDLVVLSQHANSRKACEWLHGLRENHPRLPVALFAKPGSSRQRCREIKQKLALRCVLPLPHKNRQSIPSWTGLKNILQEIQYEMCLCAFRNYRMELPRLKLRRLANNSLRCTLMAPEYKPVNPHALFESRKPKERFMDVKGHEHAKEIIRRQISWMKNGRQLNDRGIEPSKALALFGRSGSGKTLLARSIAGEYDMRFFHVNASDLMQAPPKDDNLLWSSKERILTPMKELFQIARAKGPAIVFIDEIHLLLQDKNDLFGAELLACMDGFVQNDHPILVIVATNISGIRRTSNDAFWRDGRFGEPITLDLPSPDIRREIIVDKFPEIFLCRPSSEDSELLTDLVGRTAFWNIPAMHKLFQETIQASDQREQGTNIILAEDLRKALDTILHPPCTGPDLTQPRDRTLTAWHEAGHALVHYLRFPDRRIDYLTIEPREYSLGYLSIIPDETRHCRTKNEFKYCIQIAHAGRLAELQSLQGKVHPDDVKNTGASSDIEKASLYCRDAVLRSGFDDGEKGYGPVKYSHSMDIGDRLSAFAENRVRAWSIEGQEAARQLLSDNHTALKAIAEALLKNGYLHHNTVADIVKQHTTAPSI